MTDKEVNVDKDEIANRMSKKKFPLWIGIGATVLAILILAMLVFFVVFDPFGLIDRLFGRGDPIARIVPEDTVIYLSVDMQQLTSSEELDKIIKVFVEASGGEVEEFGNMVDSLDHLFEDDYGFTFSEDINTWAGQYAGLSISNVDFDIFSDVEDPDIIFVVQVRDKSGADEFVVNLMNILEADSFGEAIFKETKYGETSIYELDDDNTQIVISRSGNFLLIGNGTESIERVIDSQNGASLADSSLYRDAVSQLPNDRMITGYFNSQNLLESLSSLSIAGAIPSPALATTVGGIAISLGVIEEGIRLDVAVSLVEDELSDSLSRYMEADLKASILDRMVPEDTFFYLASAPRDIDEDGREDYYDEILGDGDFQESLQLLGMEIGFDPLDLIKAFNGEVVIAMMPGSSGPLSSLTGIPFDIVFMVGITYEGIALDSVQAINEVVIDDPSLDFEIDESRFEGLTIFTLGAPNPFFGSTIPLVSYGVGQNYIFIATSIGLIEDTFDGGSALADNEHYQEFWKSFPSGDIPLLYIKITELMAMVKNNLSSIEQDDFESSTSFLKPLTTIGMTVSSTSGGSTSATMIFFIDTE